MPHEVVGGLAAGAEARETTQPAENCREAQVARREGLASGLSVIGRRAAHAFKCPPSTLSRLS